MIDRRLAGAMVIASIAILWSRPAEAQKKVDSLILDVEKGSWYVEPDVPFIHGYHFFDAGHAVTISVENGGLLSTYVPHITELALPVELPAVFGAGELNPLTTGAVAIPSLRAGTDLSAIDVGPDDIARILEDLFDASRPDHRLLELERDFDQLVDALRALGRDHAELARDLDLVRGTGTPPCGTEACATTAGISTVLDDLESRVATARKAAETRGRFENHRFRELASEVDRLVARIGGLAAEIDRLAIQSRYEDLEAQTDTYRTKIRDFLDNLEVHRLAADLYETLGLDEDGFSRRAAAAREMARLREQLAELIGPTRLNELRREYDDLLGRVIEGAPARARALRQRAATLRSRVEESPHPPRDRPIDYAVRQRTALLWAAETRLENLTSDFRDFAREVRQLNTRLAEVYRDMNLIARVPRARPVPITLGQWSGNFLINATLLEHRGFRPYGEEDGGVQEPVLPNPSESPPEDGEAAPSHAPASEVLGFRPESSYHVTFEVHRRVRFAAHMGVFMSFLDRTEWTSEVRPCDVSPDGCSDAVAACDSSVDGSCEGAPGSRMGRFLEESGSDPIRLNPVIGAKIYLPSPRDLYPGAPSRGQLALLLGVAVNDPLDNYYAGIAWEPITGMALTGGVHVGRDLVPDDAFDTDEKRTKAFELLPEEEEEEDDPMEDGEESSQAVARSILTLEDPRNPGVFLPVRNGIRANFFIGLSLNTNIFQSIFHGVTSLGAPASSEDGDGSE